jgi:hypothetical protein
LTDYRGAAWFLSTPKGLNYFFQLWQRGQDAQQQDWSSWQMPTVSNPFIDPREVESARHDLPELTFKQEYLAEFLQGAGAVFRNLDRVLTLKPATAAEHRSHQVFFGVDWAQKEDFTAICGFCATCKREVFLDRFNQIGWTLQRGRLIAHAQEWQPYKILAEENSIGSPNIDALQQEGWPVEAFTTTVSTKPQLIQSLALCFEREEAHWLDERLPKTELEAYEAKINPNTGRVSYGAPDGLHDDTVIARALAWWKVCNQGIGIYV